jgi:glucan phosphorylase
MLTLARAITTIENNWDTVKSEMRQTWRKLTQEDVEGINNYKDLLEKLQTVYEVTEDEAVEKIKYFIDKISLEPNLTRIQELTESLHENASEAKEKITNQVKSSLSSLQEKTSTMQEDLTSYTKENPLKVLGLAGLGVLAAVVAKQLLTKK